MYVTYLQSFPTSEAWLLAEMFMLSSLSCRSTLQICLWSKIFGLGKNEGNSLMDHHDLGRKQEEEMVHVT